MTPELIFIIILGVLFAAATGFLIYRKVPKKLKADQFSTRWKEIQSYCKDKTLWPQALMEADQMLDLALKKRKFKGRTMGERLVSAQRILENNDAVWFAHNLCKKVLAESDTKLKEADMKSALIGFRQALRDLGALHDGQSRDS